MPKRNDKVEVIHADGDVYEGYVHSIDDNHLIIHEYLDDIYRTFIRENIVEVTVIKNS